jgi:hypothetical protein
VGGLIEANFPVCMRVACLSLEVGSQEGTHSKCKHWRDWGKRKMTILLFC